MLPNTGISIIYDINQRPPWPAQAQKKLRQVLKRKFGEPSGEEVEDPDRQYKDDDEGQEGPDKTKRKGRGKGRGRAKGKGRGKGGGQPRTMGQIQTTWDKLKQHLLKLQEIMRKQTRRMIRMMNSSRFWRNMQNRQR